MFNPDTAAGGRRDRRAAVEKFLICSFAGRRLPQRKQSVLKTIAYEFE
jgi:hypothetical protein